MEPLLATRYVFTITAHVAGIVSAGDIGVGERRIIPIVGGEVRGRDINGKVCAFGADFQIVRPDSSIELEAKYALETDDGAVIYVENRGIRRGPAELVKKLNRGEAVDPALIYFRTVAVHRRRRAPSRSRRDRGFRCGMSASGRHQV